MAREGQNGVEEPRRPEAGVGVRGSRPHAGARARAPGGLPDPVGAAGFAVVHAAGPLPGRLPRGPEFSGAVSVHARHPPDDVPRPPVDHAPVRRVRHRRSLQPALQVPAGARPERVERRLRPADPDRLRLGPPDGRRRGRQGGRGHRLAAGHGNPAGRHSAGPRQHLHDDQRHRRHAAGAVRRRGAQAGGRSSQTDRHHPERHPQGIHRARHLHLPARPFHAADHGRLRLRAGGHPALEHHQHQRLPHPRGGLHRGAGGGLHAGQRHRLRGGGAGSRPRRGQLRDAALLFLQRAQRLPGGDRQVPGGAAAVGAHHARALPGPQPARPDAALSTPRRRAAA